MYAWVDRYALASLDYLLFLGFGFERCEEQNVVQVAETLVFGADEVGAGATSDLKQATKLARHMVCDCGFSEAIGPMCVDESASQATQQVADKEVCA